MAELEHLPAPKGNFTPGPECYQKCLDWVEECELLLNGPLASKSKVVKANYVLIWAGKTGRTHIKSLNLTAEQKGDPSVLLSHTIIVYFMVLTIYTRPHKLVALIFIVFK